MVGGGEWRKTELGYLKPNRTSCDLCGQLVPGRYWAAEVEGEARVFCGPEHEETFRSYWLPRYGNRSVSERPTIGSGG